MGYPVVDNDILKGIITFHDISNIDKDERDQYVEKFMTRHIISSTPDEPLVDSLEKINRHNIGRLPVVKDGRLVGIISRTDIMLALEMMKLKRY
jgi:CBS domain-containing protein